MEYDLVFEGGGAKGLAFAGALRVFEKYGHTPRRVIGTSAGSIVACLIAAGYDAIDCQAAISEKLPDGRARFASFLDTPTLEQQLDVEGSMRYWLRTELDNPYIPNLIEPMVDHLVDQILGQATFRHIISLLLWGGWYSDTALMSWLREKLDAEGRDLSGATLEEFNAKTGRDLSVVAADITGREMLVLNRRTAPNCPAIWAVRMSMGCPFAWPEVTWRAEWGSYRRKDITGHKVVDGGVLSNFPIQLLISHDDNIDEIMGMGAASENVIGLLIDETLEVPGAGNPPTARVATAPGIIERIDVLDDTLLRVRSLAETAFGAHDKFALEKYPYFVCRLPALGYGTMEFDMTPQRMDAIIQAGEDAMEAYFKLREKSSAPEATV